MPVDIFLTRRLSKSLAFCEFASVNFEPWIICVFMIVCFQSENVISKFLTHSVNGACDSHNLVMLFCHLVCY